MHKHRGSGLLRGLVSKSRVVVDKPDPLRLYREKRDPGATNEPFERVEPAGAATWIGDFVVHLHDATRRHYDLRLQVGPVLLSFAVPRGPSLDPEQRRLAVQTEDHPLGYFDFEDVIPDGSYGAGAMIVWDIGRARFLEQAAEAGLEKGKLDFELQGYKLRGRFALVETTQRMSQKSKQRQWLLIKKQDAHCVPDERGPVECEAWSVLSGLTVEQLPQREAIAARLLQRVQHLPRVSKWTFDSATPMLCASEGASLDSKERLYELKLDGVRIWAENSAGTVRMRYRSGRMASASYPELVRALECLTAREFLLDGEIVAFDLQGRPNFQRLATRFGATRPNDVRRAASEVRVTFLVFDILRLGDHDLTSLPLVERKALVRDLLPGKGLVRFLDHLEGDGRPLYDLCKAQGLEGVVSKRKDVAYIFGPERTEYWVKHKCEREENFVIVGWLDGKGSRHGFGALELGTFRGSELVYRGRVGSGFDHAMLSELGRRLRELEVSATLCADIIEYVKDRHWVQPQLGVRVRFLEWTNEGRVRMGVFVALLDVDRAELERSCHSAPEGEVLQLALEANVAEEASAAEEASTAETVQPLEVPLPHRSPPRAGKQGSQAAVGKATLSNLDKVFWPDEGYTKGELLQYYEAIAPQLLPHLRGRPVMLVRYPDGINGKNFYQWNVPSGTPAWLRTLDLRTEDRDGKSVTTFLLDDVDALLHIVNLGCIPIHVLACRETSLENCDFLTVDFDLGAQPIQSGVLLALTLKELLDELGLASFPKTSGQSGLHVLIPMPEGVPFAAAKGLLELVGHWLQSKHPELSTMERRINQRGDRVYIDTGQTGRSRTIVAPYSVRAHAGATVSTPLYWEEVHLALRPERYSMFTVPALVRDRGDALGEWGAAAPDILRAIERLGRWVRPA